MAIVLNLQLSGTVNCKLATSRSGARRFSQRVLTLQVITLEAEKQEHVMAATEALEKSLPKEYVVKVVADDDLKVV